VIQLGDHLTQDTTQATTTQTDTDLNANCGAPDTGASVWYKFSSSVRRVVAFDASASDYEVGLMVFRGTPTANSLVSCGPLAVGIKARAGATYYIMAFSDSTLTGGNLSLTAENAPTPSVHVALAKRGVAFRHGAAKVHGTYSCTHSDSFAEIDARLFQRAGRLKIQAESGTAIRCNGKRHHWTARLVSPVGTFAQGRATARIAIISCGLVECRQDKVKGHVKLGSASGPHRQWMTHPTTGRTERARPLAPLHKGYPKP
jgi:hypothetical protein